MRRSSHAGPALNNAHSIFNGIIEVPKSAQKTNASQLVVYGANETDEFHRQSNIYYEKFKSKERKIERFIVPEADHFDEMNDLSNENSEFFKKMKKFIELL